MGIRDWLAIIVIIFIVLILLDGFRRKWQDRKTRIRVKLDKTIPPASENEESDVLTKTELPNGGARIKSRVPGEVPVLMDSIDLDNDEIVEYPEAEDSSASILDDIPDHDQDDEMADDDFSEDDLEEFDNEDLVPESLQSDFPESIPDNFGAFDDDSFDDSFQDSESDDLDDYEDENGEADEVAEEHEADEPWNSPPTASEPVTPPPPAAKAAKSSSRIEPTFGNEKLTFGRDAQGDLDLEHHDLFEHEDDETEEDDNVQEQAEQVLVINVMARQGAAIEGSRLLPVLLKCGMRLGDMSIFHQHVDNTGNGPVMFSMANMLKPGTFSISDMESFSTPGVCFFMQLPNRVGNMQCFEQMLKTAQTVKEELDAVLKDENRSVFTRQTIEHSRQRIRDFELEMLARK